LIESVDDNNKIENNNSGVLIQGEGKLREVEVTLELMGT